MTLPPHRPYFRFFFFRSQLGSPNKIHTQHNILTTNVCIKLSRRILLLTVCVCISIKRKTTNEYHTKEDEWRMEAFFFIINTQKKKVFLFCCIFFLYTCCSHTVFPSNIQTINEKCGVCVFVCIPPYNRQHNLISTTVEKIRFSYHHHHHTLIHLIPSNLSHPKKKKWIKIPPKHTHKYPTLVKKNFYFQTNSVWI